jgi:hypothetical protein
MFLVVTQSVDQKPKHEQQACADDAPVADFNTAKTHINKTVFYQ